MTIMYCVALVETAGGKNLITKENQKMLHKFQSTRMCSGATKPITLLLLKVLILVFSKAETKTKNQFIYKSLKK